MVQLGGNKRIYQFHGGLFKVALANRPEKVMQMVKLLILLIQQGNALLLNQMLET
jgi:hypothetical protein